MDLTSIIGVVIGVVLIVFVGIGPKDLGNFWDPASVAIVLGGTSDCLTIRKFSLMYGIFIFDFFNTIFIFVFHMNYMRSSPCYITLPSNFVTNSSVENMLNNRLKL